MEMRSAEGVLLDDLCVVGSFLTAGVVQFQATKSALGNLWHPHGGVTITNLGDKGISFNFIIKLILTGFWRATHRLLMDIFLSSIVYITGKGRWWFPWFMLISRFRCMTYHQG